MHQAQRRNRAKAQNATSEQKKNALKNHLRWKKSLIRLFALLRARRKENRKKKIEQREKSPQYRCTKYRCLHN